MYDRDYPMTSLETLARRTREAETALPVARPDSRRIAAASSQTRGGRRSHLDARMTELGISLQLTHTPSREYQALDANRYDGPESPYIAHADTAHEAVEELIAIVEQHTARCALLGKPCPPNCDRRLGGCGCDDGDFDDAA